ncbi:hypothetical protein KP729_004055|uniref:CbrC family protein n=1 Tax=Delftia acidovorans TaxID=80866 RepID=UPI00384F7215|nr:hypothetical protein [Delftia acidovorans]
MERPHFRFHPGAYETVFEQEEGVCSCCGQNRSLKYEGPFYSQQSPDYLCPWCIASGQACETYDGELVGYTDIEGVSPDPADPEPTIARELLLEIAQRTPGYRAWQQPVWLTHCNAPVSSWVTPTGRPSSLSSLKSCPTSKAATGTMRSGCWSACPRTA